MLEARIEIALAIIFVASLAIFYIFGSLGTIADNCQDNPVGACSDLAGLSGTMIIILLLIGSFTMIIAVTFYLWMTSR